MTAAPPIRRLGWARRRIRGRDLGWEAVVATGRGSHGVLSCGAGIKLQWQCIVLKYCSNHIALNLCLVFFWLVFVMQCPQCGVCDGLWVITVLGSSVVPGLHQPGYKWLNHRLHVWSSVLAQSRSAAPAILSGETINYLHINLCRYFDIYSPSSYRQQRLDQSSRRCPEVSSDACASWQLRDL